MLIGVGVSCLISCSVVSCLYVNSSGLIISVGEERAHFSAIDTRNYVLFVQRGFLFLFLFRI